MMTWVDGCEVLCGVVWYGVVWCGVVWCGVGVVNIDCGMEYKYISSVVPKYVIRV